MELRRYVFSFWITVGCLNTARSRQFPSLLGFCLWGGGGREGGGAALEEEEEVECENVSRDVEQEEEE